MEPYNVTVQSVRCIDSSVPYEPPPSSSDMKVSIVHIRHPHSPRFRTSAEIHVYLCYYLPLTSIIRCRLFTVIEPTTSVLWDGLRSYCPWVVYLSRGTAGVRGGMARVESGKGSWFVFATLLLSSSIVLILEWDK
ncbi:unnamed protein product, partial [Sphacelaria rigidula]